MKPWIWSEGPSLLLPGGPSRMRMRSDRSVMSQVVGPGADWDVGGGSSTQREPEPAEPPEPPSVTDGFCRWHGEKPCCKRGRPSDPYSPPAFRCAGCTAAAPGSQLNPANQAHRPPYLAARCPADPVRALHRFPCWPSHSPTGHTR